jgi:hypothetical protein
MKIISRYRPIEHSLEKLRRKFHAAGGDPSAICEVLVESLGEHYGLNGATVMAMWIPRFVAKVQVGTDHFYFKIVDQDPVDTHRYMDFLAKSGFGTAEVMPTSPGERSITFAGYPAYLMHEVGGERLSVKSQSDASRAGEMLGRLHRRSEGFDIRARRSIETLIPDFASFPDLPVAVVHGDYRLVHLYDTGSRLTIGEWKRRGLEVSEILEELVETALERARRYASRMHTRSLVSDRVARANGQT